MVRPRDDPFNLTKSLEEWERKRKEQFKLEPDDCPGSLKFMGIAREKEQEIELYALCGDCGQHILINKISMCNCDQGLERALPFEVCLHVFRHPRMD